MKKKPKILQIFVTSDGSGYTKNIHGLADNGGIYSWDFDEASWIGNFSGGFDARIKTNFTPKK